MTWRSAQVYIVRGGQWVGYAAPVTPPAPDPDPDPVDPTPPAPGDWVFQSSALEGGGQQNVIAVSPFLTTAGTRPYLIGSGSAGVHRSTDRGATWAPSASGSIGVLAKVAGIMWSDDTEGKVFVAENGGIHRSLDWGLTWALRTTAVDWDADNDTSTPENPRGTGNMLAQDTSGSTDHYWCGTFTKGLLRSTDGYSTFVASALAGHPIRSIALDPNDRDVLYVAVSRGTDAQNGLWRVTNARAAMTATKMTTYPGSVVSPAGPEEVIAVDENGVTRIYVAGHTSGMFRYTPSTSTWLTINSGLTVNGTAAYCAVAADPSNPTIIYCAHLAPLTRRSIYRSANSGSTWAQISAPTAGSIEVSNVVFGQTTETWMKDIPFLAFSSAADWLASMLVIDPDIPSRVLAVGRGGAWFGTLSAGVRTWQPAVRGLMTPQLQAVEADRLVDGRVAYGDEDYQAFFSTDGARTVFQSNPRGPGPTVDVLTFDRAVTSGPGALFVGVSARGEATTTGAIMSTGTPELGNAVTWVNESGTAFSADVVALGVGPTASGSRVILAGVSNPSGTTEGGLWRRVAGTWTQSRATTGPFGLTSTAAASNMGVIRWVRGTPTVYALDNTGLWRSTDAGATWVRILGGVSSNFNTYDSLQVDSLSTAKLYLSSGGTLLRIDNASTSTGTGATTTVTLWSGQAGNVAMRQDGSEIFLNVRDGRLMRSTAFRTAASQAAASWTNIASPLFQTTSGNIRSMTCTPGGVLLTADTTHGSWRAERAV